jgi:hypothetical protein
LHRATLNVVNSGKITVSIDRFYIQNMSGFIYELKLNQTTSIDPAVTKSLVNATVDSCSGINGTIDKVIVNSMSCPDTGSDSIKGSDVTFINC